MNTYYINSGDGSYTTYEEAEENAKKYAVRYSEDYIIFKAIAVAKTPNLPSIEVIKL